MTSAQVVFEPAFDFLNPIEFGYPIRPYRVWINKTIVTMGARSSSPRTVNIENDSPGNVIDVSEAVVDRLKGLHNKGLYDESKKKMGK